MWAMAWFAFLDISESFRWPCLVDRGHRCADQVSEARKKVWNCPCGEPVARLLRFYWPLWKLPSAIFLFVWVTMESLSRLPSLLYVCPSMQAPDILVVFSICVLCHLYFSPWVLVIDCTALLPELRWGLRIFFNSALTVTTKWLDVSWELKPICSWCL